MNYNQSIKAFSKLHDKQGRMRNFIRWWTDRVGGRALTQEEYINIRKKI